MTTPSVRQGNFGALNTGAGAIPAYTFPGAVVAGNAIVGGLTCHDATGSTAFTATDTVNGATYGTPIVDRYDSADQQRTLIWVLLATAAGTPSFSVSGSGSAYSGVWALEVQDVISTTPTGNGAVQATPGTAADGLSSGNITITSATALLIGFAEATGNTVATPTVGTGFTSIATGWVDGAAGALLEYKALAATTAVPALARAAANDVHVTLGVVLYGASGGGGGGAAGSTRRAADQQVDERARRAASFAGVAGAVVAAAGRVLVRPRAQELATERPYSSRLFAGSSNDPGIVEASILSPGYFPDEGEPLWLLTRTRRFAGVSAAAPALVATLSGGASVSAAIAGVGGLGASLSAGASVGANVVGAGFVSVAMNVGVTPAALLAAQGALGAALSTVTSIAAALSGNGDLSAAIGAGAGVTAALGSSSNSTANLTAGVTCSGAIAGVGQLGATCTADVTVSGALAGAGALATSLPVGVTCTGNLSGAAALAVSIGASAAVGGTLSDGSGQSAAISAGVVCSGNITGKGALAAALSVSVTASPELGAAVQLASAITAGATCSAAVGGAGALGSVIAIGVTCVGAASGGGSLAIALGVGAACAGNLVNQPGLGASLSAGPSLSALLGGVGRLDAILACTASLSAATIPPLGATLHAGATMIGVITTAGPRPIANWRFCSPEFDLSNDPFISPILDLE